MASSPGLRWRPEDRQRVSAMTGPSQAAAPCQGDGREGAASLRLVFSRVREISQGKSEKKRERRASFPGTVRLVSCEARTPASNFTSSRFTSQKSQSRKERVIFLKEIPQLLQMFWFILWGGEKASLERSKHVHSLKGGRSPSGNSLFAFGRIAFQQKRPGIRYHLLTLLIQ